MKRHERGFVLLVVALAAFVLQSELVQYLQSDMNYYKPYFILYIAHSIYFLMLPFQFLIYTLFIGDSPDVYFERVVTCARQLPNLVAVNNNNKSSATHDSASLAPPPSPLQTPSILVYRSLLFLACKLYAVFTLASYSWYTAVSRITMGELTAIYNCSCFFAYCLAILMLKERLESSKILAVLLSITGIGIISLWGLIISPPPTSSSSQQSLSASPSSTALFLNVLLPRYLALNSSSSSSFVMNASLYPAANNTNFSSAPHQHSSYSTSLLASSYLPYSIHAINWVGYGLALWSSFLFGFYEVVYKKYAVPTTPSCFFSLHVTGLIGLATMTIGVLPIPLLHATGIEIFQVPTIHQLTLILLNGLLGFGFNSIFMLVIAFLGPVMAAVGVMLTIPLTTLADYVLVGTRVGWNTIFGSCFILAGYSLLLYSDMVIIPAADDTNEEGEGRAGEVVAAAACVEEQDEEEGDIIKNLLPSNERTPLLPHH